MRLPAVARIFCICGLASIGSLATVAQTPPESVEAQVRAVFLLRMAQFIDWPATPAGDPGEPFEFCVVRHEAFRSLLESAVRAERIGGRPARVLGVDTAASAAGCELLYIPAEVRALAPAILARLPKKTMLTVAGYEGFLQQGGAIEMYRDRGHIRFRINRRVAESAGLGIRSQLLGAAAAVTED